METRAFIHFIVSMCLSILLLSGTCIASIQSIGQIHPGFQGSQMNWVDNNGLFLLSNDSNFAFGFSTTQNVTLFLLVVVHMSSSKLVWTANRGSPVTNSDNFVFEDNGNVYLENGGSVAWSLNTAGKGVTAMELQDTGNLVLFGNDSKPLWQSFSHPSDTLLSNQVLSEEMRLVSNPNSNNLSYYLELKSGNLILYAGFQTPQPYWSMAQDTRNTINQVGGKVTSASLTSNSWRFYDRNQALLWQFIYSDNSDPNITWAAVLGNDGLISFYNLQDRGSSDAEPTKIPQNSCSTPEPCDPYNVCYSDEQCQCPEVLSSLPNCNPGIVSPCNSSNSSIELVSVGDRLNYFALGFVPPQSKSNLNACKDACLSNCSCLVLFFESSSGSCFLFDQIGSLQPSEQGSTGFVSYVKATSNGDRGLNPAGKGSSSGQKHFPLVVIIAVATVLVIVGLLYLAFWYHHKRKRLPESPQDTSEEDNFLESLSGMPIRFSYKDLQTATNNFSSSEKSHFPSFAFKMMEEGKIKEILDSKLNTDEEDGRVLIAIKVALWCIQEDMSLRPSMTRVVQMLEGLCAVPQPPNSSQMGSRLYSNFFKSISEEGTSSGPSDCNSDTYLSAVRLSGPR
ncbi:hypothetical protein HHK36_013929 [Tetracentron sinense]|uniref:Bulb-type lectin domain-containing protein n=1 Tax=Tetracentron sinense TaxID=13715 RepID=A0A834Z719_TETSI|nr:hypothetical protein HHK36_013929 [Tetracentron sinense]